MSNSLSSIASNNAGSVITTTGTTTGNWLYSSSGFNSSIKNTAKYNILGEDIEFPNLIQDIQVGINLSLINLLGKTYYDELKKNGVSFVSEIDKVLKEKLKIHERDKKISTIIDEN